MPTKALDFILSEPWAIQPEALETILAVAQRANCDLEALEARLGKQLTNAHEVAVRDGVAVVPVRGPIFRYANLFTRVSDATSLEVLARDFTTAADSPEVREIVLAIDSPGGQATGIADLAGMIRNTDKPVTAYIEGAGASAAYWIAAATERVVVSSTALIGSVGVVATYRPPKENEIRIVSSQSPLKQATPDTEAGRIEVQRVVDDLAAVFIRSVADYRGIAPERVAEDFGRGGLLVGAKAVDAGMADGLGSLESVIAGRPAPTPANNPAFSNRQHAADLPAKTTPTGDPRMTASDGWRQAIEAKRGAGMSLCDATKAVVKEQPDLHARMLTEHNSAETPEPKRRPATAAFDAAVRQARAAGGKSHREAVRHVVLTQPDLHARYLQEASA